MDRYIIRYRYIYIYINALMHIDNGCKDKLIININKNKQKKKKIYK